VLACTFWRVAKDELTTVILCGGRGTRAHPHTEDIPKPLLAVGDRPILHHVMEIYAEQGLRSFVLSGGYLVERIEEFAASLPTNWDVEVVDTGLETGTGERIRSLADRLPPTFLVTYGDGVGDVDLAALLAGHRERGGPATLTCVPLPSPFGVLEVDEDLRIRGFLEKPALPDHLINAGFFAFDRDVFEHWSGDDLEREVLPGLAAAGLLHAHRHDGFWRSMDTYKDAVELAALCADGTRPWSRT
jgi:glucose-1-phosphate cytidylyltransferase